MADAEIVPFGKYKGQPVEALLTDSSYCEWLASQPWFRERYGTVYQTIINYGTEPQDSPEHNEMQVAFLDSKRCVALVTMLGLGWLADSPVRVEFEVKGWDVVFVTQIDRQDDDGQRWQSRGVFGVELKPDLGDDFPSVLRQVTRYPEAYDHCRAVIVRRHAFERVTWDQVSDMFAASGIRLILEADLDTELASRSGSEAPGPCDPSTDGGPGA